MKGTINQHCDNNEEIIDGPNIGPLNSSQFTYHDDICKMMDQVNDEIDTLQLLWENNLALLEKTKDNCHVQNAKDALLEAERATKKAECTLNTFNETCCTGVDDSFDSDHNRVQDVINAANATSNAIFATLQAFLSIFGMLTVTGMWFFPRALSKTKSYIFLEKLKLKLAIAEYILDESRHEIPKKN